MLHFPSADSLNQTVVEEQAVSNDDSASLNDADEVVNTDVDLAVGKELTKIGNILISTCCDKFCLRHLTVMDVIDCKREIVHCKTAADRKKWLHAKLADSSSESSKGVVQTRYFVAGKKFCSSAWCTRRTLQKMQQRIIDGDRMELERRDKTLSLKEP